MISVNIDNAGYNGMTVLNNFTLEVPDGEIAIVLGASGCGKSTLLRIIAGLRVSGLTYNGSIKIGDSKRVGFIPQNKCLLPWKTVYQNIVLLVKAEGKKPDALKANQLIKQLGIGGLEGKYPRQLSGGQYQRVMLGQAFFCEPDILLMDEPFTALDRKTKSGVMELFLQLQGERRMPCVFVTHDLAEAEAIAESGRGRRICMGKIG